MKPRVRWDGEYWVCEGWLASAYGTTPEAAYVGWCRVLLIEVEISPMQPTLQ